MEHTAGLPTPEPSQVQFMQQLASSIRPQLPISRHQDYNYADLLAHGSEQRRSRQCGSAMMLACSGLLGESCTLSSAEPGVLLDRDECCTLTLDHKTTSG